MPGSYKLMQMCKNACGLHEQTLRIACSTRATARTPLLQLVKGILLQDTRDEVRKERKRWEGKKSEDKDGVGVNISPAAMISKYK